jgi:hypothetical protein
MDLTCARRQRWRRSADAHLRLPAYSGPARGRRSRLAREGSRLSGVSPPTRHRIGGRRPERTRLRTRTHRDAPRASREPPPWRRCPYRRGCAALELWRTRGQRSQRVRGGRAAPQPVMRRRGFALHAADPAHTSRRSRSCPDGRPIRRIMQWGRGQVGRAVPHHDGRGTRALVPSGLSAAALRIWGHLRGRVSLEVYGHLRTQTINPDRLFREELAQLVRSLGLARS